MATERKIRKRGDTDSRREWRKIEQNQKIKGNTERKRYLKYSMLDRKEKDGEIERELQRWQKGEQESKTT